MVWGTVDRNNPDALENLPKIRTLLFEGKINQAERLAALALSGTLKARDTTSLWGLVSKLLS